MTITLGANNLTFKLELVRTVFKGYEVILQDIDEEHEKHVVFPDIKENDSYKIIEKNAEQKFTTPPAHFSEAKIVKIMEEVGIGRPSTYVSTIDTLQKRKYVSDNSGILKVTQQGHKTAHVLDKYFPEIVGVNYTAKMEEKLDDIQDGKESKLEILTQFNEEFEEMIGKATELMYADDVVETGKKCPKCGSPLIYKEGKNGTFIGCSSFPKCDYVEKEPTPVDLVEDQYCPECGAQLVYRKGKDGKKFVACSGYPNCKYTVKEKTPVTPYTEKDFVKDCPKCGGHMVVKKSTKGSFLGCTNFPKCHHIESIKNNKGNKKDN
jgi:DNA topoisomerase-1